MLQICNKRNSDLYLRQSGAGNLLYKRSFCRMVTRDSFTVHQNCVYAQGIIIEE
jgi:hypothetical protein